MGMDLYRVKDNLFFRWPKHYWLALLELAERYGWKPEGTKPSDLMQENCGQERCDNWSGHYDTNEYQIITDKDAKNMANALKRALPDIPNKDAIKEKQSINVNIDTPAEEFINKLKATSKEGVERTMLVGGFTPQQWDSLNCFEKFADTQSKIREFIDYLRVSGCEIH